MTDEPKDPTPTEDDAPIDDLPLEDDAPAEAEDADATLKDDTTILLANDVDAPTLTAPPDLDDDDARYAPPSEIAPIDLSDIDADERDIETIPGEFDIDSSLAAVAELGDLYHDRDHDGYAEYMPEDEVDIYDPRIEPHLAEQEQLEQEAEAARRRAEQEMAAQAERIRSSSRGRRSIYAPPLQGGRRGNPATIIPALILIALGSWLTFELTVSQTTPDPLLLGGAAVGGVVLTLLVQWAASGRWQRGTFFFGVLVLLLLGTGYYLTQPGNLGLITGYPLFIVAVGVAVTLAALLTRPASFRMAAPGLVIAAAGGVAQAVVLGYVPQTILTQFAPFGPVIAVVFAVIFILPLIVRRRD